MKIQNNWGIGNEHLVHWSFCGNLATNMPTLEWTLWIAVYSRILFCAKGRYILF